MNWKISVLPEVEDFISSLEPDTIAKVIRNIDLLQRYGAFLGMPHAKKINIDLWELRIRGRQEVRILYGYKGKTIILLHSFVKKRMKIAEKELKIAKARLSRLRYIGYTFKLK